jgi:hypothetical protein
MKEFLFKFDRGIFGQYWAYDYVLYNFENLLEPRTSNTKTIMSSLKRSYASFV